MYDYRVELSQAERGELTAMLEPKANEPPASSSAPRYCWRPMPAAATEEIARTVAVAGSTVYRTKRRFVEGNLESGAERGSASWGASASSPRKEEALLVATA